MIKLSALEAEALEMIEQIQEFFSRRDASRPEFTEIMGRIRDLRVKLTNKQFGCASGKHSQGRECECVEPEAFF